MRFLITLSLSIFCAALNAQTFSVVEGSFTWQEAIADADSRGGRLAVLDTQEKIDMAVALAVNSSNSPQLWIGLSDEAVEGEFVWINGTPLGASNWIPGQPDDSGGREDYVHMKSGGDWAWNDRTADTTLLDDYGYLFETAVDVRINERWERQTSDSGDIVMIDHINKVMWPYDGSLGGYPNWYDGMDFATNLTLAGFSDWRLPTPIELGSLVDGESPLYQLRLFNNTEVIGSGYPSSLAYWTNETDADDGNNAYYMHITDPHAHATNLGSHNKNQSGGQGTIRGWPVRFIDYDLDGLLDIDELNTYNTSPYLNDTDGDGVPDGLEITEGTDPNDPSAYPASNLGYFLKTAKFSELGSNVRVSAISSDGNTIAAKDYENDFVTTLRRINGQWIQVGNEISNSTENGSGISSIALSADGNRLAIGSGVPSLGGGFVKNYQMIDGEWVSYGSVIQGSTSFAGSIDLSADGNTLVVGNPYQNINSVQWVGEVKVFHFVNGEWTQLANTLNGEERVDMYGNAVSISSDGSRIAVGAFGNGGHSNWTGKLFAFELAGDTWMQLGATLRGDNNKALLGSAVTMSGDGNVMAAYSPRHDQAGRTYIFKYNENEWIARGNYIEDENFTYRSRSISLSQDGSLIAIGQPISVETGTEIYQINGNAWNLLDSFDSGIGSVSLSSDGNNLLVLGPPQSSLLELYERSPTLIIPVLDLETFYESSSGESITIDATPTDGYPSTYTYEWSFNDGLISPSLGGALSSLTLTGNSFDNGTWKVAVTNVAGTTETQFEYRVFADSDEDGLSNYRESNITNTNPDLADTDSDNLNDYAEIITNLTDPNDNDSDDDGLLDGDEVNTYSTDPNDNDSDDDGLLDGDEVNTYFTNPNLVDSDSDTLNDADEVNIYFTNPNLADSDSDTLNDADEINTYLTNPNLADSDADGLSDNAEITTYSTDPILADTSGDGLNDGAVVNAGFTPTVDYSPLFSEFIQDARPGNSFIERAGDQARLQLQIERSDDLESWSSDNSDLIQVDLPMTGNYNFFRFTIPVTEEEVHGDEN